MQGKRFTQLNQNIQSLADKLVTSDFISNIEKNIENVDASIDAFAKVFDMPGSMK